MNVYPYVGLLSSSLSLMLFEIQLRINVFFVLIYGFIIDAPAAVFDVETQRLQMDYEDVMFDRDLRYLEAVENDCRYSAQANWARTSNVYRGKVLGYGLREVYLRSWHDDSIDVIPIPDNAGSEFFDFFRVGDIAEFITNDKKLESRKFYFLDNKHTRTSPIKSKIKNRA